MIEPVSNLSQVSYKKILKPILFLFPADSVHKALINSGFILSHIAPMRWLLGWLWGYQKPQYLAQIINGVYFPNPVGLSAGFDKDFKLMKILPCLGFGSMELGSMTNKASAGNPRPHYRRLKNSQSILVYAGLNNQGSKVLIKRIKNYPKADIPLDISVAKTNSNKTTTDETGVKDYTSCLDQINKAKVGSQITINISCPNAYGGEPFTTPARLNKLLKEVDKLDIRIPVYLKMPSDLRWPEFKKLIVVALKHNVQGLKICNLAKDRTLVSPLDNLNANTPGNMSGRPVRKLSNELIYQTYAHFGDQLIIVGIGGIFNAQDAYEKIKSGATAVELITGMIFEGPQVIGQINKGLVELLTKDGFTHISQAIGSYHRK